MYVTFLQPPYISVLPIPFATLNVSYSGYTVSVFVILTAVHISSGCNGNITMYVDSPATAKEV